MVVGQDGLVANVAKYVQAQPVIGVDPLPGANAGVLVAHRGSEVSRLLRSVHERSAQIQAPTINWGRPAQRHHLQR